MIICLLCCLERRFALSPMIAMLTRRMPMRREGCTDSISLRVLGWNAPPWHAATDGAGCTAELGYGAPAPRGSAYEQARMRPGFACIGVRSC